MANNTNTDITTILVIEDDKDCHKLAEMLLLSSGYKVIIAESGNDAIDCIRKTTPDLILLDLSLPDMSGLEIAKSLSSQSEYSDIPIIIMSADDTANAIDESYQYNVYDYIIKPINPSLLVKQVTTSLFNHTMKKELLLNEQRLSKVQQLGGIGTWVYQPQKNTFKISNELLVLFSKNEREVDFNAFLFFIHKNDREEFKSKLLNAMNNGIPFTMEHRVSNNGNLEINVIHSVSGDVDKHNNQFVLTGTVMDVTNRINENRLLSYTRFHDMVTDLPNHENFCNRVGYLMSEADASEKLMGVLMVGIDKFKNINESLGRVAGDEVLIALAERFKKYENVDVYRYAGDIFAIIIKEMTSVHLLESISEDIFSSLVKPLSINGENVYLSVNIGAAVYPMISGGKDELISAVESAMYQAKRIGGDRMVYFDTKQYKSMKDLMLLESDLRKALDNNEFEVYYQPQVSVQDCKLIGMEALVRWNHPEYGIISPDQFIPIAEDIGLIWSLGDWIMESAIKQVAQWSKKGFGVLRVGVNISPYQFEDQNLFKNTVRLIKKYGVQPSALTIEITENVAMRDVEQTIKILKEFTGYGIQSSMDDFGTGYSSLSYLKQMPLQTLKIDRSFISDITKTEQNGELAKVIIAMSHTLGLNVVAEGVENNTHLNFLRKFNCSEAQGFLFSRPVPAQQFEDLFLKSNDYKISCKMSLENAVFANKMHNV